MDNLLLLIIGTLSGFISGLFGVGGGSVTIPLLLSIGVPIKFAIGISSMQMVTSSVFGTILNKKHSSFDFLKYWKIGFGGVVGGIIGAKLVDILDGKILAYIFLALLIFAIVKVIIPIKKKEQQIETNFVLLFSLGAGVGAFGTMIGIGGGIILVPLLVSFFGYSTKEAAVISLFFIVFASSAGFITLSFSGYVDYLNGLVVALGSLVGVKIGGVFREGVCKAFHKKLVVVMYSVLLIIFTYKMEIF